jgi:Sugar kinases, ribokinase family
VTSIPPARPVFVIGRAVRDLYLVVDRYPAPGEEARIERQAEFVGGSALNIAVNLRQLGVGAYLVACVGDDPAGASCLAHLRECGLATDLVTVVASSPTATSLSVVDPTGERTFFAADGPTEGWPQQAVLSRMEAWDPALIVLSGYALADPATSSAALSVVREAASAGRTIVFDPGPALGQASAAIVREVLGQTTWLLANVAEIDALEKMLDLPDLASVTTRSDYGVVVKDGSRGATMDWGGVTVHVPGTHVAVVDTTGAGDAFAAGFVASLVEGRSPADAVAFANACGAWATTVFGPHGIADRLALETLAGRRSDSVPPAAP